MQLITSGRFEEHVTPPGHPERPERAAVFQAVSQAWRDQGGLVAEPCAAARQDLARVHSEPHLDAIEATAGRATMLDADTFTSPESHQVALLAAGATLQAARHACRTREVAFAFVRPPGHHAERDRPMGFCLYNNVAVAAAAEIAEGARRVAIVDIDVHHGNGTQWMFYDDPRVLYISSHQFPFYPGTGSAEEIGRGAGTGFTVNIPLEAGATDADYDLVYRAIAVPVLEQFAPELTLVSAGFDAHEADPLASMRMSASGYARTLIRLAQAARHSGVLALVTEGGYDLPALKECLTASLEALHPDRAIDIQSSAQSETARGERALRLVRRAQAPFWRDL